MENGPFEDVFPINKWGYSIAMLVYRRIPENGWFVDDVAFQEDCIWFHLSFSEIGFLKHICMY